MKHDNYFKISEFAELGGISRKMLIHYDKVGVLIPDYTDPHTGYRYYSVIQVKTLKMIKTLQFLGVSLKEIKEKYMEGDMSSYLDNLRREKLAIEKKYREILQARELIEGQLSCMEEIYPSVDEESLQVKKLPRRYFVSSPLMNDEPESMAKIIVALEKKIFKRDFLMNGELAVIRRQPGDKPDEGKHYVGIFTDQRVRSDTDHVFEVKSGNYLSFHRNGFFVEGVDREEVGAWHKEHFRCIDEWCRKNHYTQVGDIIFLPVLLPFYKIKDSIYEVQVRIEKKR